MAQLQKIKEAADYIKKQTSLTPHIGIILGSGLGSFTEKITKIQELPYEEIPHFPYSTVEGHSGRLILGKMGAMPVVVMAGRFHYYEGYGSKELTFPIRVLKELGIHTLIISNAAGGLNPSYKVGDLMIVTDHINLQPDNPLRGKNEEELGPRFPDMSEPYPKNLVFIAKEIAEEHHIAIHTGVYVGVQGPTFETRSEYKYLRTIGGDAVGMSTVPETIVAVHAGLKVFAISVITDIGIREEENVITHEDVLMAAAAAEPNLTLICEELITRL